MSAKADKKIAIQLFQRAEKSIVAAMKHLPEGNSQLKIEVNFNLRVKLRDIIKKVEELEVG